MPMFLHAFKGSVDPVQTDDFVFIMPQQLAGTVHASGLNMETVRLNAAIGHVRQTACKVNSVSRLRHRGQGRLQQGLTLC